MIANAATHKDARQENTGRLRCAAAQLVHTRMARVQTARTSSAGNATAIAIRALFARRTIPAFITVSTVLSSAAPPVLDRKGGPGS